MFTSFAMFRTQAILGLCVVFSLVHGLVSPAQRAANETKDAFIDRLVSEMTVSDMALQLHLMFADNIVGPKSDNALWNEALFPASPDTAVGVVHDWYPLNKSYYNGLQSVNLEKSRLKIPFMHIGECLHGVGSFKQSMFPQTIGLAATFDTDLVRQVGRAIGAEARSIGVHACLAPVLDLCQDQRWGRCQEDWGEDYILTSHLGGIAYTSGLSGNSSWSSHDAVVPVMKHFAAHGAPQSGHNAAPFMGHGNREVLQNLLVPFKAAVDLGGARGVMMAYNELDSIPASVNPMLYDSLDAWGFNGFVIADDTGMSELQYTHMVSSTPADTIAQWFNAGGMINYYDYPLETFLNATVDLVANSTVAKSVLKTKMSVILGVKYDLGLFDNPYIPDDVDPHAITASHVPLTLEAAQKSIVLLENKNATLPLTTQCEQNIALIGPFGDTLNYGDYSGQFGSEPIERSSTIRQGLLTRIKETNGSLQLAASLGSNSWLHNSQNPIPGYHLSTNGSEGGLLATYYADTNFSMPMVRRTEVPVGDWGLYPPDGLPSNNFSAVWEGTLTVPTDGDVDGWLGVAISANTTAKLYVDGNLHVDVPLTTAGNILSNIPNRAYNLVNSTAPPPGSSGFTFRPGAKHYIRLEYQAYNLYQKLQNLNSLNAQIILFWNLVDRNSPIEKAVAIAEKADTVILALGANWNSDGEGGDRGTMGLSDNQTELADAIFALGKPVVLVLQGGRPFAIPEYYNASSAVLNAFFPGQQGGQAIADALLGLANPGGRLPLTIPKDEGQMPVYYNQKASSLNQQYLDTATSPAYSFGYGLSYTNFTVGSVSAGGAGNTSSMTFTANSTIHFSLPIKNTGAVTGSYVPQIYLLQRVSQISQPVKQLVAFTRVYLEPGEERVASMELEVDRYLKILNRKHEWEVEKGEYVFALQESGSAFADASKNVTMRCV